MTDAHIIEATLRELAEFCPAARAVQPRHARVHRIPLTVPCPEPGFEALRPMANVDALPGLFLAGDWTRTDVPVSMESAVRSGRLAAEALLWRIGAPRMLVLEFSSTTGIAGMIRRARERRLAIGGAQ